MVRRHEDARRRATKIGVIRVGDLVYSSGAKAYRPTATTQEDVLDLVGNLSERAGVFTKNAQDAPPLAVGRNGRSWDGLDAQPKMKGKLECSDGLETSSARGL